MTRQTRRWFLRALAKALTFAAVVGVIPSEAVQAAFGGFAPTPQASQAAGTLTVVNPLGSPTAASGSVTQSFGWLFPQGACPPIAQTTATLNGTTSITVASAANMAVNQTILADGIPSGTHITNIVGTTITLSQAATVSASGVAVVIPGAPLARNCERCGTGFFEGVTETQPCR